MSDDLSNCVRKATGYLANAKILVATDFPNGAITSSYYCFFWLVRGLLASKHIVTKRHSSAREMFSLHYIKSGEIPEQYKDDFATLFEQRQLADYDIDGDFSLEDILHLISLSENFLAFVNERYA
ncbi:HEPN domain-containing protein [Spirosoma sordidisoli]|uniref:HEPN domain-containing protein n=1 Tax=Spirosoma sordidisoli TaxID=2502893 RepID=A0A4V1RVS0_9BACT|nr:HEPN domain-containing protein [Spirosoma sordidisoli]RYC67738.1 HEPN domain-containing protein [Spirosoma sordidisoli]